MCKGDPYFYIVFIGTETEAKEINHWKKTEKELAHKRIITHKKFNVRLDFYISKIFNARMLLG